MRRLVRSLSFLAFALLATPAAAVVVDRAADICPATADPCVVSQAFDVAPGSVLDFGLRTLVIEGAGTLDVGDGRGTISCGRFETRTTGAALRARAGESSAELLVQARKRCSAAAKPCMEDSQCEGAGQCTAGDGSIDLRGGVFANSADPGRIVIRSAGDLALRAPVSIAGTRAASDGGTLEVRSLQGTVSLEGTIDVSGGSLGGGGEISVAAFSDVSVSGRIVATGGEYDGGSVALDAGRDVSITQDIAVDATSGAGAGGEIDVVAGRDIMLDGGTASNVVLLGADGHQSAANEGGDGGAMSFEADRNIRVGEHVRLAASPAAPDGFGDTLSLSAEVDASFDGTVVAKGRGTEGAGALVELQAGRDVHVGPSAALDLTGAAAGGDLFVEAGASFAFDGAVDVSGGSSGIGGRIVAVSGGDSRVGGSLATAGAASVFTVGEVLVEGCRVRVGGRVSNGATSGRNRFLAHESLSIVPGASVVASGQGGQNSFVHREEEGALAIGGTVAPSPLVTADASLAACAVCGDLAVEGFESCDDGNTAEGDGCSSHCEDEGCIAGTPGHPAASLCDDGDGCTADRCNSALRRCEHVAADCSDGVACTVDACVGGRCTHTAAAALCDDRNVCTEDSCDAAEGCVHRDAEAACDDGAFCNGADSCAGAACAAHAGDPCASGPVCNDRCDEARDSCFSPAGTTCAGDANACTDEVCDGVGGCTSIPNDAPCDDLDFCTTGERCRDGECGEPGDRPVRVTRLRLDASGASGEHVLAWKAVVPTTLVPADPSSTSLALVLADAQMRPLVDVVLPAGVLVRGRKAWQYARGEDESFVDRMAIDAARRDGRTRVHGRLSGLDLSDVEAASPLRLTLLFGEETGQATCLGSNALECRGANRRTLCRTR